VRLVRLDPMMGEAALRHWVEACEQAKKPAFLLQGTMTQKLPKRPNSWSGSVIRVLDWIVALVLLIGLSPSDAGVDGINVCLFTQDYFCF
jgi:hypothetical protein